MVFRFMLYRDITNLYVRKATTVSCFIYLAINIDCHQKDVFEFPGHHVIESLTFKAAVSEIFI